MKQKNNKKISKKMHLIESKMFKILSPSNILLDVSPSIILYIMFPTSPISSHPNTSKHAITDNINIITVIR